MDIKRDMVRLEKIMNIFSLYPVKLVKGKEYLQGDTSKPLARLIFCNILADKHDKLRQPCRMGGHLKEPSIKKVVSDYLGMTSSNSVKHQLREGAIQSIQFHTEYMNRYKMIKAGFTDDERYLEIERQQIIRDAAQDKMTELTKDIIK